MQLTDRMQEQIKINLRYLKRCVGWTTEQCIELKNDYENAIKTKEGFKAIAAHLETVGPWAHQQLEAFKKGIRK